MSGENINLCDYAVAFVDLLGQKADMPGRHLPNNKQEAIALVKRSVGKIVGVQKLFESFYLAHSSGTTMYSKLPKHIQDRAPDMAPGELKRQVFSDGIRKIGDRPRFSIFRISFKSAKLWPNPYSLAKKGNNLEEVLGRTSAALFIT